MGWEETLRAQKCLFCWIKISTKYIMPINITGSSLTTGLNCTVPTAPYGSMSLNGINQAVIYSYFDGFNLATGNPDFSIELWFYARSYGGLLIDNGGIVSYSYSQFEIGLSEVGILSAQLGMAGGTQGGYHSTYIGSTSSAITLNTWNHVALVRNGSYASVFLNGVIFGTVNVGASFYPSGFLSNGSNTYLGGYNSIYGTTAFFYGYISNVRIVKYASAYNYDNNFVPPSIPFSSLQAANTNGIPSNPVGSTQTTFLLNTLNNSTVLQNGSAYITTGTQTTSATTTINSVLIPTISSSSLNPFPGSIFFNGINQYLTVPANTALNLTADFTVEAWAYATTTTNSADQVFNYGDLIFMLYHQGTTWTVEVGNGASNYFTLSGTASLNAWHHFAITRSTNTYTFWIDGVLAATATNSNAPSTSGALYIGQTATIVRAEYFTGYISNFRIVKGTAVYTSNFTPPTGIFPNTQPLNLFGNPSAAITGTQTSLLLKNTYDSNFLVDYSVNSFTITNNGTAVSSTLNPFNGYYGIISNPGSVQFNGTSQYLSVPANASLNFGTGDFTVEAWIYHTTLGTDSFIISSSDSGGLFFGFLGGTSLGYGQAGSTWDYSYPHNMSLNAWYHVALTRSGTSIKMFVNGIQLGVTQTSSVSYNFGNTTVASQRAAYYYAGYISNVRVVKGVAVYTSNFVPPAAPLNNSQVANQSGAPSAAVNISQTSLLLNTAFGNDFLFDTSINNLTVTNVGTAISSTLDPF
jgi:hypothetical protein